MIGQLNFKRTNSVHKNKATSTLKNLRLLICIDILGFRKTGLNDALIVVAC